MLCLIRQASFAHFLQVVGNLVLHVVGHLLIFLDLIVELLELIILLDIVHAHHIVERLQATFTEESDLLASL